MLSSLFNRLAVCLQGQQCILVGCLLALCFACKSEKQTTTFFASLDSVIFQGVHLKGDPYFLRYFHDKNVFTSRVVGGDSILVLKEASPDTLTLLRTIRFDTLRYLWINPSDYIPLDTAYDLLISEGGRRRKPDYRDIVYRYKHTSGELTLLKIENSYRTLDWLHDTTQIIRDSTIFITHTPEYHAFICGNKLIMHCMPFRYLSSLPDLIRPVSLITDLQTGTTIQSAAFYPEYYYRKPIPAYRSVAMVDQINDSMLVYSFRLNSLVQILNTRTNTITTHSAPTTFLADSLVQVQEADNFKEIIKMGWYRVVKFDPYRNKFIRFISLPAELNSDTLRRDILTTDHALVVYSKDFKVEKEIRFKEKLYYDNVLITQRGILVMDLNKTNETRKFSFKVFNNY